jgi:hypothetical protein
MLWQPTTGTGKGKGKAIPLQALTGPEGSRRLRLPDFKTISIWRWQVCQSAALTSRKYSWYSFMLEAESTQGHSATGRIMSMKKSSDTIGNRTRGLPVCSAVPQPLCHRVPHNRYRPNGISFGWSPIGEDSTFFVYFQRSPSKAYKNEELI